MKLLILLFFVLINSAFAETIKATSIGEVSQNLMEPLTILSEFISTACVIIGASSLFGAFLRYMQYRVNPLAAPISSVIILLIIGLVLLFLPLLYKFTENGIPYHYF